MKEGLARIGVAIFAATNIGVGILLGSLIGVDYQRSEAIKAGVAYYDCDPINRENHLQLP